jgi:hypothetical protein
MNSVNLNHTENTFLPMQTTIQPTLIKEAFVSMRHRRVATTFTLFPRLPFNLRSKIWSHSLPLFSRIIELKSLSSIHELRKNEPPRWLAIPTSKPTLLSINRESRRVLSPYYATPFQARRISPHLGIEGLLINYKIDTLFINIGFRWPTHSDVLFSDLLGSNFEEVKDNLKLLAGTEYFWETLSEEVRQRKSKGNRMQFIAEFGSLREAIVVAKNRFPERIVPWRLIQFVDLHQGSEERRRVQQDLPHFFDPYRKKRYSERLCAKIEKPSILWKLISR